MATKPSMPFTQQFLHQRYGQSNLGTMMSATYVQPWMANSPMLAKADKNAIVEAISDIRSVCEVCERVSPMQSIEEPEDVEDHSLTVVFHCHGFEEKHVIQDRRPAYNPLVGIKQRFGFVFHDQRVILQKFFPMSETVYREIDVCYFEAILFGFKKPNYPRWEKRVEYMLAKKGIVMPPGIRFQTFGKIVVDLWKKGVNSLEQAGIENTEEVG